MPRLTSAQKLAVTSSARRAHSRCATSSGSGGSAINTASRAPATARPGATVMMHRPVRRGSRRAGSVSQVSCPAPRSGAPTHEHVGAVIQGPLLPSSKSALRSDGPSGPATALRNRVSLASASFSLRSRELGIWSLTRPGSLLRRWTRLSDCLYPSPCQSDPSCDRSIPHTGAS